MLLLSQCYVREPMVSPRRRQHFFNLVDDNRQEGVDCEFTVNRGFVSAQLLAKIKHHVSSLVDDLVQLCTPNTWLLRVVFMRMMKEWEVHSQLYKNDDLFPQELGDCASRVRPGDRIFVGSVSTNTRRQKAGRMLGPKRLTHSPHT